MPAYQLNSTFSKDYICNYFTHLNPLAQKISDDINCTKLTYDHLWYTLNPIEQNDIINETLIKPEISLKYIEDTPSPTSIASLTDSENLLFDLPKESALSDFLSIANDAAGTKNDLNMANQKAKLANFSHVKAYYEYDGQHLRTFLWQKVALRLVQDDILGVYRDEHSCPFSYRTKSQIRLNIIDNTELSNALKVKSRNAIGEKPNGQIPHIHSYKRQTGGMDKFKTTTNENNSKSGKYLKSKTVMDEKKTTNNNQTKLKTDSPCNGNVAATVVGDSNSSVLKNFLNVTAASGPMKPPNYAVFIDSYAEQDECSQLMKNCGSPNGKIIESSSSSLASDEDHDDGKMGCEDIKLLDNLNLRKGFDFLNNW